MDQLSDQIWDTIICGTSLKHSLLALALSRSKKRILHIDANDYYGGLEAAFSLHEFDQWVERHNLELNSSPFKNITSWRNPNPDDAHKVLQSRSYTLSLSPQIIYAKSLLLSKLVSSMAHRQLEFQAVGYWWIFEESLEAPFKKIPAVREDIAFDKTIDNIMKRRLMKFFKFVVDYENKSSVWKSHSKTGLGEFLSTHFSLPSYLHPTIAALTLTLKPIEKTTVKWSLPRIARHLASLGTYGNGLGAVTARWGGCGEICQVACRASAVGGGVYMLGADIETACSIDDGLTEVHLTNGYLLKTRYLVSNDKNSTPADPDFVCRTVAVVSAPLKKLFDVHDENSTLAAASIVNFPQGCIQVPDGTNPGPVYVVAHSSDTGECPPGQCVLYATMMYSGIGKTILDTCITKLLDSYSDGEGELLFSVYYEQESKDLEPDQELHGDQPFVDLAFDDSLLTEVESMWHHIMKNEPEPGIFMKFKDNENENTDDLTEADV